jgi:Bacteriophage baseplate protein W
MMQIAYPFHFDNGGRTASSLSPDDHIRDMIEQILFTSPGERVNRPDFGCGVLRLIFRPNSDVQAAAAQFLIQGALQQQMGDSIEVEGVEVQAEDASLIVLVQYTVRRTQQSKTEKFVQGAKKR